MWKTRARQLDNVRVSQLITRAEQLVRGIAEVRRVLGPEVPISDHDIRDSLYYYYYDVSKTIKYILSE